MTPEPLLNRNRLRTAALVALSPVPLIVALAAPGKMAPVSFVKSIQPVLRAHCTQCHSADSVSGGLRLDTVEGILKGGRSGPLFVAGHAATSRLIKRLTQTGPGRMPMGFPALPAKDVQTISVWIDQGARVDSGMTKHWAYVAPVQAPVPKVNLPGWGHNPIDAFVVSHLAKIGLTPSPKASPATLLRRVCLDLTGLPPTEAQRKAFLSDPSPAAYRRLVDALLNSPQYGERMATPWLDLARYADTNGYEKDDARNIWPYRDWVVNAFNADMPYDQFTVKQLAGDLLPDPSQEDLVATGFNRNTMLNQEGGVDKGEQRWLTLVDRVGTTGSVFLGTTLMCCQCHDHKYDPFTQADFYKMLAFYQSSDEPTLKLYDPSLDGAADDVDKLRQLAAKVKSPTPDQQANSALLDKLAATIDRARSAETLILKEKANDYPPTDYIRIKGSYLKPGKKVVAGTPAVLPPMPPGTRLNRLGLAEWLVDRSNPLTARVEVNRLWSMLFGIGLVKTEGDFGTQGERPTYQDMLDWLAVDFMHQGWSIKKMLRLIVTSNTYQQDSAISPTLAERDRDNRLLARGPRFRLSAEMIRDDELAVSGLLSLKMGGPSVMPDQPDGVWNLPYNDAKWVTSSGEDRFRRGLYTYWRRTMPYPAFVAFDATSRESCTVNRIRTNTPLQALVMLNDPVVQMCARSLAAKMLGAKGSDSERLAYGFQTVLVRDPKPEEASRLLQYLQLQLGRCAGGAAAADGVLGKEGPIAGADPAKSAAYLLTARVLLNLDETITKE